MATLRNLALLAVIALAVDSGSAFAAKGGKNKGEHALKGVVESVELGKVGGSFTIKTHKHKNGKAAGKTGEKGAKKAAKAQKSKTINITPQTQFIVMHKGQAKPATAAALRAGEHVVVEGGANGATKVIIHHGEKKAKKKEK
jgi:hypothetical protein